LVLLGIDNWLGRVKTRQEIAGHSRALKRYKKSVEDDERQALNKLETDKAAERKTFGRTLSEDEVRDYEKYAAKRKAVKAERRKKLASGFAKLSSDMDKGSRDRIWDDRASTESPFSIGVNYDLFSANPPRARKGRDMLSETFSISRPRSKGKRKRDPLFDLFT
jgi:hypothetical protein